MISQERKSEVKSEGESEEFKKKISNYYIINKQRRWIPVWIVANLIFLFISFVINQFSDCLDFLTARHILYSNIYVFGVYTIFYLIFSVLIQWRFIQRLKKLSQPVAFYAAVSAAEQLEKDNLIETSFYADKLLGALSFLVMQETIEVKPWKSALKNLLYVKPGDIKNKAVHGAIQDRKTTKNDFVEQFYDLADSLSKAHLRSREFKAIGDFLEWVSVKSQTYESEIGFWARHQNYKILLDIMAIIAPIIVAILMLID